MQREKEMEILPNDLMVQIFSRFPSKSVARFCTLSKHWASTFQSQEFAELFLARSSTRPRLLFAVDQYAYNRWQIFSTLQPQNQYEQSSHVDFHTKFSGDEEDFLAGLTKQLVDSSLENDFSGGFSGTHAVPACNDNKAWCVNRLAGTGCCCQNQKSNQNSGVSSWDLYCAMAEEVARMSITVKPYLTGRGLLDPPTKLSSAPLNHGTGYYNHHQQTLALQKLQAIQFQQLKQQQLMNQSRVSFNGNKNVGPVDLSSSAWSNQLPRL